MTKHEHSQNILYYRQYDSWSRLYCEARLIQCIHDLVTYMQSGIHIDVTLVKLLLMIIENISESHHSEPGARRNARRSYDDRAEYDLNAIKQFLIPYFLSTSKTEEQERERAREQRERRRERWHRVIFRHQMQQHIHVSFDGV